MTKGVIGNAALPKVKVKTLLQGRSWAQPLKTGLTKSDVFEFEFDGVEEASSQFKPMVRDLVYDCGELAVVTHLQAKYYGKPLVLLPFVVSGNFHHKSIAYNTDGGEITPETLAGRSVGVRTYSQTTGVWVRGILQNEYGADLSKVTWVTFDEAHLTEHADPENCVRAPAGKKLISMLLSGELDAGMLGSNMPKDPRLKPVITDPEQAAKAWQDKYQVRPINHMFVVTKALCDSRPDVVRSIFELLVDAREATESPFPSGFDGDWSALDLVSNYAFQQGVVPRRYSVDELFADAAKILNH